MNVTPLWAEMVVASEDVCSLLYQWRADPSTLTASIHTSLPDYETFRRNCTAEYFASPDLCPFFVRKGEERIAFIRWRPYRGADVRPFITSAEISIIVHPQQRRQGVGIQALRLAEEMARQRHVHTLYSLIRPDNEPSKKLFCKAGYTFLERTTVSIDELQGRQEAVLDVYVRHVLPEPKQQRVFLVAEIGSNWQVGNKAERRQLAASHVIAAGEAGFDAVKFQTFRAESVYAPGAGTSDYLSQQGTTQDIHELFHSLEMAYDEIPYLAALAQNIGLAFMSTPFSPEDVDAVDPYVIRHKIASYEIAHTPLLQRIGRTKKPVFMSTGASFPAEIAYAVDQLKHAGCPDITLLQCTACYPAHPTAMNLRAMRSLSSMFGLPVGLSDHSLDCVAAPVAAVAYGARVIEKHVTIRRSLPTPDSFFSLEPPEMKLFVEKVRLAEQMAGSAQKYVNEAEEELFAYAKRAIQAIRPIKQGEILRDGYNVAILRPGKNTKGAHPSYFPSICGKKAVRDIAAGEGIQGGDNV